MISRELKIFFFNKSFACLFHSSIFEQKNYTVIASWVHLRLNKQYILPFLPSLDFMMPNVLAQAVFAVFQIGEGSHNKKHAQKRNLQHGQD